MYNSRFGLPARRALLAFGLLQSALAAMPRDAQAQTDDPLIDLVIDKSHAGNFRVGQNGTYSITVTNNGDRTTTGAITVMDNLPTGLGFVSAVGTGWTCGAVGSLVTCSNPGPLAQFQSATITLVVSVAATAIPAVVNTAVVSTPNERIPERVNNTDSDPTTVINPPNIAIAKTAASAFVVGQNATYSLAVTNVSLGPTTGTTSVTDVIPPGLTFVSATGVGWSCTFTGGTLTCNNPSPIPPGITSTINLTVAVGAAAAPSVTNTATVSTPGDTDPGNDRSVITTPVTFIDLAIAKTHSGNFTVGQNATYTITVTNIGTATTTGSITVSDNLPAGLSFVSAVGIGWNCGATGASVTCSTPGLIAPNASASFALTVAVGASATPTVVNTVSVTTPGDSNPANDTASDPANVVLPPPDLSIVKSANPPFTVGSNATYTLTVTNVSLTATTGTVTVTDNLPNGLTFISATGTGWSCGANAGLVSCTSPGPIAGNSSAPDITLTVGVGAAAAPSVTNAAVVTTPGDSNPGNDNSTITTPVVTVLDVAIAKTSSALHPGANGTFTLTVANVGAAATIGVISVSDLLPAGLTFVSASGGGFTCGASGQLVACARSAPLAPGQSASITLTVAVSTSAPASITNTGDVTTPGDSDPGNNSSTIVVSLGGGGGGLDPDLEMKKTILGAITAGQNATFLLTIRNVGVGPTVGLITVTDVLPIEFTYVSATGTGWSCSAAGQAITCVNAGPLAPAASSSITVVAATAMDLRGFSNTAVVKTPGDGNADNDTDTISIPTAGVQFLDLALTKTASSASFTVAQPGSYTLTVTNVGTLGTIGPITVTDIVPNGLTVVSATGTGWICSIAALLVTCTNAGPLNPGESTTITLSVLPIAAAVPSVTNSATVSTPGDGNPGNDGSTISTPVGGTIDLVLSKTGPDTLVAGGNAVYALVVRNLGSISTIGPITIVDTLPVGLTFVSGAGGGFSCAANGQVVTCTRPAVPALAPATSVTLEITAAVAGNASISTTNRACVATTADANPSNDCATSTGTLKVAVDLSLTKEPAGNFVVGGQGKYTLTVRNIGTGPATPPMIVRDTLPNGMTFVSGTGTGWACSAAGNVVTCTLNVTLAAGAAAAIDLTVTLGAAAVPDVSNCATVRGTNETGSLTNNIGCATTPVAGEAALELVKRASRNEANIGDVLDYTLVVKNSGTADLASALVVDDLPLGFAYEPRTARVGGVSIAEPSGPPAPRLTFVIGAVPRNATVTLTYRVRITAAAQTGNNTNVAVTRSSDGTKTSPQARATTRVTGGLFEERGAIVGKVFTQCNCASAMQEAGEVGIPGVRVVLEDGTSAVTDVEGKYNFYNVASRLHLVKIDRQSLPASAVLVPLSNRNALDGYTRFADVKGGELHKADFAEGSGSADVLRQVLARRRAGEVENAGAQIPDNARSPLAPTTSAPRPSGAATPARDSIPITYAPAQDGVMLSRDSVSGPMRQDSHYRPLLGRNTLTDFNSQLPASPLRALAVQQGRNPSAPGRVLLDVPNSGIPADGQTLVTIGVRVLDATGNALSGRTPVTLEASLGRWLGEDIGQAEEGRQVTLEGGAGSFTLIAAAQPGRGEVRVTTPYGTQTMPVTFVPAARSLMAAGLLNARIDLRSLVRSGNALASDADGFEESLRDWTFEDDSAKVRGGARGALLLKGRVFNDQLLTLSYDSERDRGRTYFRDIRPDEFFPVYGDASIREFDAQSRRRFYGRLDRGTSYTMFGDFQTSRADDRRVLTAYDRTLNGAMQHFEGARGTATLYASQGRARQAVDELPGRGISGPYVLTGATGLINSERVELVTRDRNQPTVILSRVPMTRFADYTIEPLTGRLIFRAPVPSADANLNPIFVRVTYETENASIEKFWVYGGDASLRLTDDLEVGGTYAQDESPFGHSRLAGANATARLGNATYLLGELAQTTNDSRKGDAFRLELRHQSERVEGRLFFARSDSGFSNRSSTFYSGRTELGGRFTTALDDKTRLIGEALRTENNTVLDGRRDGAMLAIERQLNKAWRAEVGYRYAKESGTWNTAYPGGDLFFRPNRAIVDNDVSAVRGRLNWTLPEKTRSSLFAEYEQDIRDDSRRGAVGGEYIIANRARVYGRHEWLSSVQGPYATYEGNDQQYTVFGVDADYFRNTQMFSEYRVRDAFNGRDGEASIGLRNRWAVAPGLLINTSFERVSPLFSRLGTALDDELSDALAVTGAVEWTRRSLWKSTARLEFRNADSGDNFLGSFGYARKLSRDWTLLGRTLWDVYNTGQNQTRGWSQLGFAWRETDRNKWNALLRYENRLTHMGAFGAVEQTENLAHILAALVNYQPTQRATLSGRYAAKTARDDIGPLRTNTTAQLLMGRGIFDLTSRLDAGVIGSLLASDGFSARRYGLGGELGVILIKNLRVAGGYNLFGFTDKDLDTFGTTRKGAYLELGFKFDESLFGLGVAGAVCDNACRAGGKN